jgi:glycosyltransferase involved in cell wall biosynthesis
MSQTGSFAEHIVGISDAAINQNKKFEVWTTCNALSTLSENFAFLNCEKYIVRYFRIKALNYIALDLISSIKIIALNSAENTLYIRPNINTIFILLTAKLKNIEVILEINGIVSEELRSKNKWFWRIVKYTEKIQMNLSERVICVSEGIGKFYSSIVRTKILIVPNGCRKADISNAPMEFLIKGHLDLVFIGSLVPWQGLAEFVRLLTNYSKVNRVVLHIYGSGPLEQEIKNLCDSNGINAVFYGWISPEKLEQELKKMHLAILPRLLYGPSGSPLKLFKYIAVGLPVITTEADGVRELGVLNDVLFKYDWNDGSSLFSILDSILSDQSDLTFISNKMLDIARNHLTWDDSFKRIFLNESSY